MKKSIIAQILAGMTLAALTAPAVHAQSAKPTKIVVADAKTTHHLNLYVAKEKGLLAKRGLEVEIVEVKDLAAARDLVVAGKADVYWACPTAVIAAIANGAPIRIISQVKAPCTSVLVVPPDSPIQDIKDLKGKRVAGISPTCEAVIAYTRAAKLAGAPFRLEKLAGGPAIAALEARAVDAAILEEPQASIAELKGYRFVRSDVAEGIPCRTINARTGVLQSNAAALKALIEAVEEANALILKDPVADEVVAIAHTYTGAPHASIKQGNHRLRFGTTIKEEGLSLLADALVDQGDIKENPGTKLYAPEFKGITWGR
ncbi:MAG: ABC transporter substrate-binding protein [Lentisphaerae bacterium]|nr:ABC transporter substrate-binding protein [Lentisphaerota bacterium]